MSIPESDDDATDVKFRLTHAEWDKLTNAIELIEQRTGGPITESADRLFAGTAPSKREGLVQAILFVVKFVKEKITEV